MRISISGSNKIIAAIVLAVISILILARCASSGEQARESESAQQGTGVLSIVRNQPVPDLGGFSFEREILRQTYLARNNRIATYSYYTNLNGDLIEICASMGYPIPYATQMTNPQVRAYGELALPQSEPNSLYPPSNAAATLVACTDEAGNIAPAYIEQEVMAFPFRVKSARQIERLGQSSFNIKGQ
jgi:hypothetical protein